MTNMKILVVIAAAVCGSIMNPSPQGQVFTVMLESALAEKNRNDPRLAEPSVSEGMAIPAKYQFEPRLYD